MSLIRETQILATLIKGQPQGIDHTDRLNRFYAPQAHYYDIFRERLLHGRKHLIVDLRRLLSVDGASIIDMGGGTGHNLGYFGNTLKRFERIEVVDLCRPLLDQARSRWHDFSNIHFIEADATSYQTPSPVDAVYFSYSLTMIPNWFDAINNAIALLKPGGFLGVVDFYVSRAHPGAGRIQHSSFSRHFWPIWFGRSGVRPNQDHLPYLLSQLAPLTIVESHGNVPYLPGLKCPYYRYIGQKPW